MSNSFEGSSPELSKLNIEEGDEKEFTPEEMREKLRDPSFLPFYSQLSQHFENVGGNGFDPEWKKWRDFCWNNEHIFEIWTKEYIHAFVSYLAKRVEELGGTKEFPTVILEVGAGNGRLTHFLSEKLNELIPGKVKIIASDSGGWGISPTFPVENIPHNEALVKHKPKIVIFSWMPYEYDCTDDFRSTKSIDEYILIGETDGGCCGDGWKTWGSSWSFNEEEKKQRENQLPPYKADGFERVDHDELRDLQLSRINIQDGDSTTKTVSFKRKK